MLFQEDCRNVVDSREKQQNRRSEQWNVFHVEGFLAGQVRLKGIHLPPSDILRRLYCTSRPSWWSRRCPRRTNERPLKRDEERKKNVIDFCDWISGKMSESALCSERRSFPFKTCTFPSRELASFLRNDISFAIVITYISAKLYISLFTFVQIAIVHR